MYTYGEIETDKERTEIKIIIYNICHLKDYNKQNVMAAVEKTSPPTVTTWTNYKCLKII